nr:retrovirus-related Pol polyprotein from transposon TNT 1-94 [Tanacetum cinerariifolium]
VLKETLNLGLWYLKGPGFNLKAYSDSDYVGCNLDRKSTPAGNQILGGKLVCWSAKKQSSVAMSSTKAKYVVVSRCCAQVL